MSLTTSEIYQINRQIAAGAQFLDTAAPDWCQPSCATPIDLTTLNLGNFTHCILGQLVRYGADGWEHRSWSQAIRARFPQMAGVSQPFNNWARDHGFYPSCDVPLDAWTTYATARWALIITRRRAIADRRDIEVRAMLDDKR